MFSPSKPWNLSDAFHNNHYDNHEKKSAAFDSGQVCKWYSMDIVSLKGQISSHL